MIATDFQPFSIVEDEGFQLLLRVLDRRYQLPSRKHFSEHVIPKMYTELKEKVSTVIKSAKTLALTTDCWTSRSTDSYISITSHFIDDKFKRQLVVLDTFPMCERHTAQNLLSKILSILEAWMIDKKRVTYFVQDNTANITAAVRDGVFVHIGCIDHTLQLAINDGLDDEVVAGILKSVKSIVSHFHRSTSSRQFLSNAQTQLQLPVHQLCQEVSTRWNSTFYMLERISEQRRAITSVLPDTTCSTELTIIQWNIIQQLILLLRPFEEFSREFERADASISLVIPGIRMLCKHLSKPVTDDENRSVRNVREGIASSLQTRFSGIELWELHSVATLLDPRFKVKGFLSVSFAELAKSKVLEKAKEMADPVRGNPEDNESVEEYHTRNKKSKESSLWEEFDVDKDDSDQPILSGEEKELEQYLSIPRLPWPHADDPLNFWRIHETRFPHLTQLAKTILGIPPTSAESERVFSCAGNIVIPTRTCLDPQKVRMLVFLHKNNSHI